MLLCPIHAWMAVGSMPKAFSVGIVSDLQGNVAPRRYGVTTLAFALAAFALDRSGHKIISPFFAAGAWLFGAFGVLVWYWR